MRMCRNKGPMDQCSLSAVQRMCNVLESKGSTLTGNPSCLSLPTELLWQFTLTRKRFMVINECIRVCIKDWLSVECNELNQTFLQTYLFFAESNKKYAYIFI